MVGRSRSHSASVVQPSVLEDQIGYEAPIERRKFRSDYDRAQTTHEQYWNEEYAQQLDWFKKKQILYYADYVKYNLAADQCVKKYWLFAFLPCLLCASITAVCSANIPADWRGVHKDTLITVLGVCSAILASNASYWDWQGKAERHRATAKGYAMLLGHLESLRKKFVMMAAKSDDYLEGQIDLHVNQEFDILKDRADLASSWKSLIYSKALKTEVHSRDFFSMDPVVRHMVNKRELHRPAGATVDVEAEAAAVNDALPADPEVPRTAADSRRSGRASRSSRDGPMVEFDSAV